MYQNYVLLSLKNNLKISFSDQTTTLIQKFHMLRATQQFLLVYASYSKLPKGTKKDITNFVGQVIFRLWVKTVKKHDFYIFCQTIQKHCHFSNILFG